MKNNKKIKNKGMQKSKVNVLVKLAIVSANVREKECRIKYV